MIYRIKFYKSVKEDTSDVFLVLFHQRNVSNIVHTYIKQINSSTRY